MNKVKTSKNSWQSFPEQWQDDDVFLERIIAIHQEIYKHYFSQDLMVNHQLEIKSRSFRVLNQWRIFLLTTPWMLARFLIPESDPDIIIPDEWSAEQRQGKPYEVLGTAVKLPFLPGKQQAHFNYQQEIGHYFLQPLAMNMSSYQCAEDAFEAWNQVIKTRNENMEKYKHECNWHKEISRREFFTRHLVRPRP